MSLIRWLSVALATLATAAAANAQTAPIAALGVTAVFGQEASNEAVSPDTALLPGFVPACLECWTEQLGSLACHFQPLTLPAQQAMVISEVVQALMAANSTDELLQGLRSFNDDGQQATLNGGNIILRTPGSSEHGVVVVGFSTPNQVNGSAQNAKPVAKSSCCEAGCCAAVSTAKTCPACEASQKVKQDIAALLVSLQRLQTQMTAAQSQQRPACAAAAGVTAKADCCCAKTSQVNAQSCASGSCCTAKQTITKPITTVSSCSRAQGCGCCQTTGTSNKTGAMVVSPSPLLIVQKMMSGDSICPFFAELQSFQSPPMPAHGYASSPMMPPAPPMFFGGYSMPPASQQAFPGCVAPPARVGVPTVTSSTLTVSREAPAQPALKHNVHLVTPQMEAHCQRLTSAGNGEHIILEGDVQLTCNRNGQMIRIQGQRVIVHLADGTFTVESASEFPAPVPVSRVRAVVKPAVNLQTVPYRELAVPPGPVGNPQSYYPE